MATWTELVESRFNPDDPKQGLLGGNAILGNTWIEEWLQSRGAENLLKRNFPNFVPEQPEILKGATGLFDSLGKKRKKVFDHDGDSQVTGHEPEMDPVTGVQAGFLSEIDFDPNDPSKPGKGPMGGTIGGGFKDYVEIPPLGLFGLALHLGQNWWEGRKEYKEPKNFTFEPWHGHPGLEYGYDLREQILNRSPIGLSAALDAVDDATISQSKLGSSPYELYQQSFDDRGIASNDPLLAAEEMGHDYFDEDDAHALDVQSQVDTFSDVYDQATI